MQIQSGTWEPISKVLLDKTVAYEVAKTEEYTYYLVAHSPAKYQTRYVVRKMNGTDWFSELVSTPITIED